LEIPLDTRRKLPLVPTGAPLLLRDLIHERTGIFFEESRVDQLIEKLEPLVEGRDCNSYLDYYYLLKYEENGVDDWRRVMDVLSVQETYFWREMAQVRLLVDKIVPDWFARNSLPLTIWSAASASGEEAYTISIALLEAGYSHLPIEIAGSDASPDAIEKARAGIYREKSFRSLPPALREKYFTPENGKWRIRPEIASRVRFQQANLLAADEINLLARARIIFCRNVFIYFSPHAIRQTLATFSTRMPANGYLFVGASESLLRLTTDFELREIGDAFAYVRI
jgi:chemotaxis protein methyltransferase CheR